MALPLLSLVNVRITRIKTAFTSIKHCFLLVRSIVCRGQHVAVIYRVYLLLLASFPPPSLSVSLETRPSLSLSLSHSLSLCLSTISLLCVKENFLYVLFSVTESLCKLGPYYVAISCLFRPSHIIFCCVC